MKKIVMVIAAVCLSLTAVADEGMWLLPYLQKMNIKDMKAKGCKLSAEDIYSLNKSALKDAIVIFGGGCTGEIVSGEGLLLTNHHCGYGNIQSLSSVENDYLKNGFWAMSKGEEIPAPELKVKFIRQIIDVTAEVLGNVPSTAKGEGRAEIINENTSKVIADLETKNPNKSILVDEFFGGNQFFAFVVEIYTDVRLVGAPPTSIGKFGGETDNWMWPRHTGDFAIFRVYAGENNAPADFAPENKPYKAEKFLKVSLDGYKKGDFAMIMGFPGTTKRYMTSYEIDRMLEIDNPQRIFIRGERQEILKKQMVSSDKIRIQYASKYANSSNYWKNSIGMSKGIKKLNVKGDKEAQEAAFQQWAEQNTLPEEGFIDALPDIKNSVEQGRDAYATIQYLSEGISRAVEITSAARALAKVSNNQNVNERQEKFIEDFYKDYDPETDRLVAYRMFEIVGENCKNLPTFYKEVVEDKFGGQIKAFVDDLYANSNFATKERAEAFLAMDSVTRKAAVDADPVFVVVKSIAEKSKEIIPTYEQSEEKFADAHRLYIAGLMRQQPNKAWASDANFTLRLTYGNVLPYIPADGVLYDYYTTLRGVIEKEDNSNPTEFTVPERLKELYAKKDYGRYADANGELPVAFLSNLDITGGNSGSPIMNSRGELIGLAFDGNWEAMSGDVAFEPALQRTISVDIRYVLFVVDKFAGAGWLLDEMQIVKR